MKKLIILFALIAVITSCEKRESTNGKVEWFSYDFQSSAGISKQIKEDQLNIESYYRGVYAEMIALNVEQKRDISFGWKNHGNTYTLTVYLAGGTSSNERRTDPVKPPPPPPPKMR